MADTYTSHFGIDFLNLPDGRAFPRVRAALEIAMKWRDFEAKGITPDRDPADCMIEAAQTLLAESFIFTPWAEQMLRDITKHKEVIFMGPASSGKSHVLALGAALLYACDSANTACIMCSTTTIDLKKRAWSPLKEIVTIMQQSPHYCFLPLKILENEYCICNVPNPAIPETLTNRASISGVALEEGRIQGTHVSGAGATTLLVIDELSTITALEALETGIINISTGTDYRFFAAANPESWTSAVSSKFFMPPGGPQTVTPETGSWMSDTGYFVRHFDGEKSPAILFPERAKEWHFLLNEETRLRHLARCKGDRNADNYFKMVRGFPKPYVNSSSTVLDMVTAMREKATEPLGAPLWTARKTFGKAAGVDPAYSATGDQAIMATIDLVEQDSRVYLDFQHGVRQISVVTSQELPVLKQLRDGVVERIRVDKGPDIKNIAFDSSGNQALHDEMSIYVGPGCLAVNSSMVASDFPLRAGDPLKAKQRIADRGTESWMVLAEFIKAGQVRGLPQSVVTDLCNRKFLSGPNGETRAKSKLEPKDTFCARVGHGSPNEADACALAALAAKERLGVMPFGGVPPPQPGGVVPNATPQNYAPEPELPETDYTAEY